MQKGTINGASDDLNGKAVGAQDGLNSKKLPDSVWEAIFDSIPDLVTVIDKDCRIVRMNKAMAERLGGSEEAFIGRACYETIHGLYHPHEGCPHVKLLNDGLGHSEEMYEPLLKGVFMVTTTPVYNPDGTILGSVHVARDITSRKQMEVNLQKYNLELEELNASKDKFFSVIAHDLKSPFQGLLGFTDLLLEDFDILQKEDIHKYLLNIRNASYNTYGLLENLLEWSRIQSGRIQYNPVIFSLSDEIAGVLEILSSNAIRKGISLVNKSGEGLRVSADQHMVHSVLQNLVSNAIKFSHARSQVIISTEIIEDQPEKDDVGGMARQFIRVHVTDEGIGIPQEAQQRLFSLTDHYSINGTANEPGTGLGLILSKEMVERQGGELTLQSTPGAGSVFSFTLPMAP